LRTLFTISRDRNLAQELNENIVITNHNEEEEEDRGANWLPFRTGFQVDLSVAVGLQRVSPRRRLERRR